MQFEKKFLILGFALLVFIGVGVFYFKGVKDRNTDLSQSTSIQSLDVPNNTEMSSNVLVKENSVYQDKQYGFQLTDYSGKPIYAKSCMLDSNRAYNPIASVALTRKPSTCAHDTQDTISYYGKYDLLGLAYIYDRNQCKNPKPDIVYPGGGIGVGDTYFCADADKLPLNSSQKITGFGLEGGKQILQVLKNEKYIITLEDLDFNGETLEKNTYLETFEPK